MKKSTVGMLLLVAMVVAKAYVDRFDSDESDPLARTVVDPFTPTKDQITPAPAAQWLAAEFTPPSMDQITQREVVHVESSWSVEEEEPAHNLDDQLIASNDPVNSNEEALPLDQSGNTGYGFLSKNSENWKHYNSLQEQAPRELKGEVPLDGSNTISESMSKLFPLHQ